MKAMCQRLTQLALAMLVVALIDVPLAAASWRTIAAAVTVDEAGTSKVLFGANGNAGFRDGVATPVTLAIRYNVVPVDASSTRAWTRTEDRERRDP